MLGRESEIIEASFTLASSILLRLRRWLVARNADVVTSEPHPYYMHNVQTLAPPIAQPINSSLHENGSRLLAVTVMIALEAPVSHIGSIKARNFYWGCKRVWHFHIQCLLQTININFVWF